MLTDFGEVSSSSDGEDEPTVVQIQHHDYCNLSAFSQSNIRSLRLEAQQLKSELSQAQCYLSEACAALDKSPLHYKSLSRVTTRFLFYTGLCISHFQLLFLPRDSAPDMTYASYVPPDFLNANVRGRNTVLCFEDQLLLAVIKPPVLFSSIFLYIITLE